MPLARLRAALPAAALSLLLLTGCTATDDGVTPASAADTSASASTMPTTPTPSVDAAATSRAAASSLAASSAAQSSRAAASSSSGAAESRAARAAEESRTAEGSRSAEPAAPAAPADVEGDVVTVESISDGDTIRVTLGEVSTRVRLLNIDTPETKHPSKAVQCLGPEATDLLESLLEPGDDVVLRYDKERTDRHGRTLAGVFEDEVLLNAEIARIVARQAELRTSIDAIVADLEGTK